MNAHDRALADALGLDRPSEPAHSLQTPCCDAPVLTRPVAELWYQSEQAPCPDCGDMATVDVSEDFVDGVRLSMGGPPERGEDL